MNPNIDAALPELIEYLTSTSQDDGFELADAGEVFNWPK